MTNVPRNPITTHKVLLLTASPGMKSLSVFLRGRPSDDENRVVLISVWGSFVGKQEEDPMNIEIPFEEAQVAWDKNPDLWFVMPSLRAILEQHGDPTTLGHGLSPEMKPFALPEPMITRRGFLPD